MEVSTPRIVYMGTPEFAVAPLEKLLDAKYNVVGVITAPDRPAGRGKRIRISAVKEFALQRGLSILQPENLKDPGFLEQLRLLGPDLQVVVAFRMLPEVVWTIPPMGTFNLHASLLPHYRGAAPINHVIINGESRTGVTTFMIDAQIDTGNILLREETLIGETETAGELHDRLMKMGADLVLKTIEQMVLGNLKAKPQEEWDKPGTELRKAPKIHKEDCRIDWTRQGMEIYNLIRGLSPFPGAFTSLERDGEKMLCKIYSSRFEPYIHTLRAGSITTDGKKWMRVAVIDGFLDILILQQEGRRRMEIVDFLAGTNLTSSQSRFF